MDYIYKLISFMFGGVEVTEIVWPRLPDLAVALVATLILKYITYRIDKYIISTFGDYYTFWRWIKRDVKRNDANRKQE